MLEHLHIEHFALIDDLDIDFKDNMNVIIGESGAGKSILMRALSLLTGAKSDYDKIRYGEEKASIEGTFILDENTLNKLKDEYEDYLEDNTLIISRFLDIKNKSIQRVNGHSVPLSVIKGITKILIDIHSPSGELFFYDEKKQVNILDNFIMSNDEYINVKDVYQNYERAYNDMLNLNSKIEEINNLLNSDIDKDYMLYQLNELNRIDIKENELEELEAKFSSLQSLSYMSDKINAFLNDSSSSLEQLFKAKRQLENLNDDSFSSLKEKYLDAYYNLSDAHDEINDHFKELLDSASSLEEIKSRLYTLRALKRKYGSTSSEIIDFKNDLENKLEELDNAEYNLSKLNKEKILLEEKLVNLGEELNKVRVKFASLLEKTLDNELKDLLFESASFKVEFTPTSYYKYGTYRVRFLLSANKGMKHLPLKDTISLGESSRLMLAFKKVFFDFENTNTLIFDEIDIGISGSAALAIGNKIKEIARLTQVIVISHLSQVSIKGDHFYLVKKHVHENKTYSSIVELEEELAIKEIAKMMNNGEEDESSYNLVKSWK